MLGRIWKRTEGVRRWAASNLAWDHGGQWVVRFFATAGWAWSWFRGNPIAGLFIVGGLWLLAEIALAVRQKRLLAKPDATDGGARVVRAMWGHPNYGFKTDVTLAVRHNVKDGKLRMHASNDELVGGPQNDPLPGIPKMLVIQWALNGKGMGNDVWSEDDDVVLPLPPDHVGPHNAATPTVTPEEMGEATGEYLDVELAVRSVEPVSSNVFKMTLDAINHGPDGMFVALVQRVYGLPPTMPDPYGDFALAWEGSTDDAVKIHGGGNRRTLVVGHWVVDRYAFMFRIPTYPGVDGQADGIPFSPGPGTVSFDLVLHDEVRQLGRRFSVALDFDDPDSRMPSDFSVSDN